MDFFQTLISIPWFAAGLIIWPAFLMCRGASDPRMRPLRRIFLVTLVALASVAALLGVIALLGRFDHHWLPVTLLFPLLNLISITLSIQKLKSQKTHDTLHTVFRALLCSCSR